MFLSDYVVESMVKERQRGLLEEAERLRLVKYAARRNVARPSRSAPILSGIGRMLVTVGRRLENRASRSLGTRTCEVCGEQISTGA